MRIVDYLDKGASLDPEAPCFTTDGESVSYREVRERSFVIAAALAARQVAPGDTVAVLSANDPLAFSCVFGISRAGAVWCPVNPRNEAAENAELLQLCDGTVVIYQGQFQPLVDRIRTALPQVHTWVCLDRPEGLDSSDPTLSWDDFLAYATTADVDRPPGDDIAMIVGTGGTTGRPKGVVLTGTNLETMTALTLMGYPFAGRPVYLALAPLTHAAGVLCFPIMCLGGEIVIMRTPDVGSFLAHIPAHRITHTFLPPTLIYMVLGHEGLDRTDLSSLQCFWYGAAPMSVHRLEEALRRIGPVMAQLFGQTEAPMMISMLPPQEHYHRDGSVAHERLASAGRPAPLVTVAILDTDGRVLDPGQRGEIVVRSSLVMRGYHKDPDATLEASRFGWHHTGDIGYLDESGYLFIVDRAKDMIITGGFNVYSAEVEQAIMTHPAVRDCAVVGLPDDTWGERVVAVVQAQPGGEVDPAALIAYVKGRIGSVKAPKTVHLWADLPRSRVGKVLKPAIRKELLG